MAHLIVAVWGTLGDTLPYVAVGAELRRRGHEVALVSSPAFEGQARESGLEFVPVGTAADYREFVQDSRLWERSTVLKAAVEHWVRHAQATYEAIVRVHRPGETALLAAPANAAVRLAQEKLGLRFVPGVVSPSRLGSRLDPPHPSRPFPSWTDPFVRTRWGLRLGHGLRLALRRKEPMAPSAQALTEEVRRLRRHAGLPEQAPPVSPGRQLVVCFWPTWFSPPQPDWPKGARASGFPFYPTPPPSEVSPAVAEGPRPIVFTRGSVASHQRAFFAAAAECCRILGRPGALVTPHAENVPKGLPPGVRHVSFASFGKLFAEAGAVVHHGGIGTVAHALAAGAPQLALPIVGEQFDVGYRMERLGVGSMLTQEPVTADGLARALRPLVTSGRFRRRCQHFRDEADWRPGSSRAADWIEDWLTEPRPVS